eukprot:scaffold140362_cov26-Tisochrysis_lutea.AAC.2
MHTNAAVPVPPRSLEYEAYEPMAKSQLLALCATVRKKWSDVRHIAVAHRVGVVRQCPCAASRPRTARLLWRRAPLPLMSSRPRCPFGRRRCMVESRESAGRRGKQTRRRSRAFIQCTDNMSRDMRGWKIKGPSKGPVMWRGRATTSALTPSLGFVTKIVQSRTPLAVQVASL